MGYEHKRTEPMKITVQEGKEKAFDEFPGLKQEELDTVNDYYKHYLFYEKSGGGRKFWSSCCHQQGRLLSMDNMREITSADWYAIHSSHGDEISCPFCGKPVELKAKGTAKNCKKLETYIPVIFLSTADNGETIYAQAYWTNKDYACNWAAEPLYMATYVYRFRRNEAVQWAHTYYGDVWYKRVNGFCTEPFRSGGGLFFRYDDYRVIGLECLKQSFLKYIDFTVCKSGYRAGWNNLMRFLAMAAQYPENVEMLQKAGMTDVLDDWIQRKKKNAANIVWGEKDPRKAFRLDGGELKAFMSTRKSMSVMTLYKRAKKQGTGLTMADCQGIEDALGWAAEKELPKLTREYGTTIKALTHYLKRQADGERTFGMAFRTWKDYMTAAEAMELRIYREDVKFPKDLWTAHEETTEQNRKRLEAQRRKQMRQQQKEQAEKERHALLAYAERKKELEKRYGYAAEGLMIRVPENREEIVAEGKVLQHCVGGYADRHISGAVTILFLRKESAPDTPFLTVEMNGSKLVQIHGYKNEGLYTTKGRFAPDPREVYKSFLDPWLDWVANGSRRNKKGEPAIPRSHKERIEVQIA